MTFCCLLQTPNACAHRLLRLLFRPRRLFVHFPATVKSVLPRGIRQPGDSTQHGSKQRTRQMTLRQQQPIKPGVFHRPATRFHLLGCAWLPLARFVMPRYRAWGGSLCPRNLAFPPPTIVPWSN